MRFWIRLFLIISSLSSFGQRRDNTWCFGDSVKINFNGDTVNLQNPSSVFTYEQSSSISDEYGNLLFYIGSCSSISAILSRIYNANDQLMQNGDSICVNTSSTSGSLILPSVTDSNQFYIFTISQGPVIGFTYSLIDMGLNGGLGAVIAKNILISGIGNTFAEKLTACRNAYNDGWWIFLHRTEITDSSNLFYRFQLNASGISSPDSQYIGSYYQRAHSIYPDKGTVGEMVFSQDGRRMVAVGYPMIDLFDFDRCTGLLSNWQPLGPPVPSFPQSVFYGCSFSNNSTKLYISNVIFPSYISQFDLLSANIISSKVVVYSNANIALSNMGQHQLALNGKIYISSEYDGFPSIYDTVFNKTLSIINFPDSPGVSCDVQMFSVSLGSGKTYLGLPNNPNYYLGTLNCDSVSTISDLYASNVRLVIYPNPVSNKITIQIPPGFENQKISVTIYDLSGRQLELFKFDSDISKFELDLRKLSPGIYFACFRSETRIISVNRIIKN
jgi:hypothetical protein